MAQRTYRKARRYVDLSVGESVRIMRELQELSQNELSEQTGIPPALCAGVWAANGDKRLLLAEKSSSEKCRCTTGPVGPSSEPGTSHGR
jgi:hypothetical protein